MLPPLVRYVFTWPSPHNTSSGKRRLPPKIKKVVETVARAMLRGKPMTYAEFDRRVQERFSCSRMPIEVRNPCTLSALHRLSCLSQQFRHHPPPPGYEKKIRGRKKLDEKSESAATATTTGTPTTPATAATPPSSQTRPSTPTGRRLPSEPSIIPPAPREYEDLAPVYSASDQEDDVDPPADDRQYYSSDAD